MEDLKLPPEKFVEMFTWRCKNCLKEWRCRLDSLGHSSFGIGDCRVCRLAQDINEGKPAMLEFTCEECKWNKNGVQT